MHLSRISFTTLPIPSAKICRHLLVSLALCILLAFIALTGTVAADPYVCGDADGSSIVTISDAVYLISYIFAGGPAPNPLPAGDADGSTIVTISDAVYLIAYIFAGGSHPICLYPILAEIGPKSVNEGEVLNFTTSATNPNGTTPLLAVANLPANATYVDNSNGTASFTFVPDFAQAGVINVTFVASDGFFADSEVVAITVNNVNRPPLLATIGPRGVDEGSNLSFNTSATDPDGTIPVLTAENLPANAVYVDHLNGTGTFNLTPDFTQAGVMNVTFIVSDGSLADSEVVVITVNNVNQPPVLVAIGPKSVNEGANLNFNISSSDPDTTIPLLTAFNVPLNATFVDSGNGRGNFSFNPSTTQAGVYDVTFIATDGSLADSEVVMITVIDAFGTVTDIDGNVYQTIKIGNQWWMAENLKVTHYRNGEAIPNVTNDVAWEELLTGAYCDYGNNPLNVGTYGRLYNWYAVADTRNIAPAGWHVPTDEEWKQLEMYLGMSLAAANGINYRGTDEGGKLKEVGTTHWNSPNTGATNESGFSALPGGYRWGNGAFYVMFEHAMFWTTTEFSPGTARFRYLGWNSAQVFRNYAGKGNGNSIRCVRD